MSTIVEELQTIEDVTGDETIGHAISLIHGLDREEASYVLFEISRPGYLYGPRNAPITKLHERYRARLGELSHAVRYV